MILAIVMCFQDTAIFVRKKWLYFHYQGASKKKKSGTAVDGQSS